MEEHEEHNSQFEYEITDVTDWNQHTQVAYWKSRAMALEHQNRMLLDYIKETHEKQIKLGNQMQKKKTRKNSKTSS